MGTLTCVGKREGGGGVPPFPFSTENSQNVAYSLPDSKRKKFTHRQLKKLHTPIPKQIQL